MCLLLNSHTSRQQQDFFSRVTVVFSSYFVLDILPHTFINVSEGQGVEAVKLKTETNIIIRWAMSGSQVRCFWGEPTEVISHFDIHSICHIL